MLFLAAAPAFAIIPPIVGSGWGFEKTQGAFYCGSATLEIAFGGVPTPYIYFHFSSTPSSVYSNWLIVSEHTSGNVVTYYATPLYNALSPITVVLCYNTANTGIMTAFGCCVFFAGPFQVETEVID